MRADWWYEEQTRNLNRGQQQGALEETCFRLGVVRMNARHANSKSLTWLMEGCMDFITFGENPTQPCRLHADESASRMGAPIH